MPELVLWEEKDVEAGVGRVLFNVTDLVLWEKKDVEAGVGGRQPVRVGTIPGDDQS